MSKGPSTKKTGWIIKHVKDNKIWGYPLSSRDEAMAELNLQVNKIKKTRPTFTGHNWKIDSFEYWASTSDKEEDFSDFDSKG